MTDALQTIIQQAVQRLFEQLRFTVPASLAVLVISLGGLAVARLARWLLGRAIGSMNLDGRLRRSELAAIIDPRGMMSASRIVIHGVYWTILAITALAALHAAGSNIAERAFEALIVLAPRLAGGAAIVIGGMWLGLYLGRSTLIWAVNEDMPSPRKLALAVRVLTVFAAVAVAADMVNLGGGLFRAVFIVVLGGVVLCASLAVGLGARDVVRRYLEERTLRARVSDCSDPEKVWHHL